MIAIVVMMIRAPCTLLCSSFVRIRGRPLRRGLLLLLLRLVEVRLGHQTGPQTPAAAQVSDQVAWEAGAAALLAPSVAAATAKAGEQDPGLPLVHGPKAPGHPGGEPPAAPLQPGQAGPKAPGPRKHPGRLGVAAKLARLLLRCILLL